MPKKRKRDENDILPEYLSSEAELRFDWEVPTRHTRWSHRLSGTCYGKPFSVNLTRDGVKQLVLLMMDAL